MRVASHNHPLQINLIKNRKGKITSIGVEVKGRRMGWGRWVRIDISIRK
jgi:hypothetical protein